MTGDNTFNKNAPARDIVDYRNFDEISCSAKIDVGTVINNSGNFSGIIEKNFEIVFLLKWARTV